MTDQTILLPSVDLRKNIDQVYDQSVYQACAAHGVVNALDCMYDHIGQSRRFSRAWIWWWQRVAANKTGWNDGASYDPARDALELHGAVYEADFPWAGGNQYNPPPPALKSRIGKAKMLRMQMPTVDNIKRKLCLGQPVMLELLASTQFYGLSAQKNWRQHSWRADGQGGAYQHLTCIVGYDDAAGRFLVENSWGPQWADGGFFGVKYEDLFSIKTACWVIEQIEGYSFKSVENFVSIPYLLDAQDNANFTFANRAKLKDMIITALDSQGMQAAVNVCKEWSVSDKMLENMFLWPRGQVWDFHLAEPSINFDGFVWAPR